MPNSVYNPLSDEEEIIIKDKDGKIKILKGATLQDPSSAKTQDAPLQREPEHAKEALTPSFLDFQNMSQGVVSRLTIPMLDVAMKKRLASIVMTYLKGIRDMVETREILIRSSKTGGGALSSGDAEAVLKEAEKERKELLGKYQNAVDINSVAKDMLDSSQDATPMQNLAPYMVSQSSTRVEQLKKENKSISKQKTAAPKDASFQNKQASAKEDEAKKDILKMIQDLPEYTIVPKIQPKPAQEKAEPSKNISEEIKNILQEEKISKENIIIAPAPSPKSEQAVAGANMEAKTREMAQFAPRPKTKLMGPIDELHEMDIMEFRRLEGDPKKACGKLKEKIETLEKDSFGEMAQGILAWRQSPVSKLYLDMGRESIINKQSIEKIIEKRKAEARPYLTTQEFDAVMDFNEQIRF